MAVVLSNTVELACYGVVAVRSSGASCLQNVLNVLRLFFLNASRWCEANHVVSA